MKWEYKVVTLSNDKDYQEAQLNAQGQAGWALVCVQGERGYMARRVMGEELAVKLVERAETDPTLAELVTSACCGGCGCSTGCGC